MANWPLYMEVFARDLLQGAALPINQRQLIIRFAKRSLVDQPNKSNHTYRQQKQQVLHCRQATKSPAHWQGFING
ncbi:MAG: hypothetical protein LPD71_07560 [Shewanella sp.]|nr:hypothetical protein [Shewanella sp.]MCF1431368.1 hypothetical protein [Shewanella sp.]MCF1438591.1 hypothetical protein [Shewanella sp.]MCF1456733.1 hypothetical protein [Shewanella sp.]